MGDISRYVFKAVIKRFGICWFYITSQTVMITPEKPKNDSLILKYSILNCLYVFVFELYKAGLVRIMAIDAQVSHVVPESPDFRFW